MRYSYSTVRRTDESEFLKASLTSANSRPLDVPMMTSHAVRSRRQTVIQISEYLRLNSTNYYYCISNIRSSESSQI